MTAKPYTEQEIDALRGIWGGFNCGEEAHQGSGEECADNIHARWLATIHELEFALSEQRDINNMLEGAVEERNELRAELGMANDALLSAREALGDDDAPFICDAITRIRCERDAANAKLGEARGLIKRTRQHAHRLPKALEGDIITFLAKTGGGSDELAE